MVWNEVLSILEGELANFSDPPGRLKALRDWKSYVSREAAIDAAKSDESASWQVVNKACLQFAEKRTWPQVNQEQLFWIYARLRAARALVRFCLGTKRTKGWVFPDPDKHVPSRSLLEELLVKYWLSVGRATFLGSIFFDPMGPFDPLADIPPPKY
jgi:hypothetical protein